MLRPASLFIGLRYTRARRRNQFISFISLTSMLGLALGVLAMIVVLSVMNGFQQEMSKRILGTLAHASVSQHAGIADWQALAERIKRFEPRVIATAPYAEIDGMLSHKGAMQPIQITGVSPPDEAAVSQMAAHLRAGRLEELRAGEYGVILGDLTVRRLRLALGDKLTLIIPQASETAAGITPRLHRLTLVGVFKVGADLDASMGLVHVQDSGEMLGLQAGQVPALRLALRDLREAPELSARLAGELGEGYLLRDWSQTQGSLFSAMQMEKTMIGLLLMLIIAVAAFNIVATLIMVVADKRADIAILRTLGMTPGQVMRVFMVQGSVIGAVGTLVGALLGVIAALNLSAWMAWFEQLSGQQVFAADLYVISSLPSQLQWADVALICAAGLSLSFLATLYPAWRAAQTEPAEALRYE